MITIAYFLYCSVVDIIKLNWGSQYILGNMVSSDSEYYAKYMVSSTWSVFVDCGSGVSSEVRDVSRTASREEAAR